MLISAKVSSLPLIILWVLAAPMAAYGQQQSAKALERVRLTLPARALTFVPYYFGKARGFYEKEGINLELIVMRPPIGVTALQAGEVDYTAAGGLSMRAALKGLPIRTVMFIQTP